MEKAIKTLALCIVISAIIISATLLVDGRYEVYHTTHGANGIGVAIKLDTITGDVEAITALPGIEEVYIIPSVEK